MPLPPTLSVNEHGAAMARWLGLSVGDVNEVFPDLGRGFGDAWRSGLRLFDRV